MDGTDQKIKSDDHPLLNPNIPFFSPIRRFYGPETTIPLFHGFSDGNRYPALQAVCSAGRKLGEVFSAAGSISESGAELIFQDLAGNIHGQTIHNFEQPRNLVVGDARF